MFEKRKEEEESPGCSNERRFDNILFFRKRKKDSEYLGYERITTHTTLSHLMRVQLLLSCVWRMLYMPYNEQRSNNQVSFRISNVSCFLFIGIKKQSIVIWWVLWCINLIPFLGLNWHRVYANECIQREIAMIDEVSNRQNFFVSTFEN